MTTLMEQKSEQEIKQQQQDIHTDEEIEIDLMDLLRKVIGIRKKSCRHWLGNRSYCCNKYP